MTTKVPPAPAVLSKKAKAVWREVNAEFDLPGDALETLRVGLENMDLGDSGRELLRVQGLMIGGRAHPVLAAVKMHDAAYLRCMRALNLDVTATKQGKGRPFGTFQGGTR